MAKSKARCKAGYKTELTPDEEHGLWEIETVTTSGVNLVIDWNFASYVEFQKAVELFKALEDKLAAPVVSGENGPAKSPDARSACSKKCWPRRRRICRFSATKVSAR
jgi:hypothetical protein